MRLYALLGVASDADADVIKKAYRKLALLLHPDKQGDPDKFREVNEAYEVLRDTERRSLYDKYGEDSLKAGFQAAPTMHHAFPPDMFAHFFGGFGGPQKTQDILHPLRVSLEDLYRGRHFKMCISRNINCGICGGAGHKGGDANVCGICGGKGMHQHMRAIAPGLMQRVQSMCPACNGAGVLNTHKCDGCDGKKTTVSKHTVEVQLPRGTEDGHKFVFTGLADEQPNKVTGDVVFVVQMAQHDHFQRRGADLIVKHTLTLTESLCGFRFAIKHVDGTDLVLETSALTKQGDARMVNGAGMPRRDNPALKGDLYVIFSVEYPESLSRAQQTALETILAPRPAPVIPADARPVRMSPAVVGTSGGVTREGVNSCEQS
jgi:DnaJ family protein A protein 2